CRPGRGRGRPRRCSARSRPPGSRELWRTCRPPCVRSCSLVTWMSCHTPPSPSGWPVPPGLCASCTCGPCIASARCSKRPTPEPGHRRLAMQAGGHATEEAQAERLDQALEELRRCPTEDGPSWTERWSGELAPGDTPALLETLRTVELASADW